MSDSTYPYPPTSVAGRVIARERAKREANPEGEVAIDPHRHTWFACRVGTNVTDFVQCSGCDLVGRAGEVDTQPCADPWCSACKPTRVGDLLPEAIARIEAEAERQRKAAPYLKQYERGLLTVADLVHELIEHVLN